MQKRGVEVRLIHAKEPGENWRDDFDRYPDLDGDGENAVPAGAFQVHHRRRREGVLRLGEPHRCRDGREVGEEAQFRKRRSHRRPGTCRTARRAVRFRLARCVLPRMRPSRLLRRSGGVAINLLNLFGKICA